MRRFIFDTDIGSDDAIALIMALKCDDIKIEAITAVSGNCPIEHVVPNALMTSEVVGKYLPPVYAGAYRPLIRNKVHALGVHGIDGMGDSNLIHPTGSVSSGHAADVILDLVSKYPDEIEIMVLGPATNIALAILKDREAMKKTKKIWSMGTGGVGDWACQPVPEFNVLADAEAYDIMLNSGIPIMIAGFDLCIGDSALERDEIDFLLNSGVREAKFAVDCNKTLIEFNIERNGRDIIDLPDPIAMGIAMWDDIIINSGHYFCHTVLNDKFTYGTVVMFDENEMENKREYDSSFEFKSPNAEVCTKIDIPLFKKRLIEILVK
ncbi:MAG: nucleoside hydrolase [Ruminococcaceae bacterium]|nr:nucleoside hydrolase [Oscillospiraceae bacterium]